MKPIALSLALLAALAAAGCGRKGDPEAPTEQARDAQRQVDDRQGF